MMLPVPSLGRAYSIILTEERQKNSRHGGVRSADSATYHMRQPPQPYPAKTKGRDSLKCAHCGYNNLTVDKCYRLIGFPPDFKFTKKPAYGKSSTVNSHGASQYQSAASYQPSKLHYAHNVASASTDVTT